MMSKCAVPIVVGVPDLKHGLVGAEDLLELGEIDREGVADRLERPMILPQL